MEVGIIASAPQADRTLLALPTEIRIAILEYVLEDIRNVDGFKNHCRPGGIVLEDGYTAAKGFEVLNTCKQFHSDGNLLALNRTHFVVTNLFFHIPDRLWLLHPKQVEAIRNITFVADARHFQKLKTWRDCPFGMKSLNLDTLTIVLHRSNHWHYLFDFTASITNLLRNLNGVKRFIFVRNNALVKGSFKTWYNRLIGLILKIDHYQRYDAFPTSLEKVWWTWNYDEIAQSFCLEACPAKSWCGEEQYMQQMLPLIEAWKVSCENEEWNPDPRSRNLYY